VLDESDKTQSLKNQANPGGFTRRWRGTGFRFCGASVNKS